MIVSTFHNPGWFAAHVRPLLASDLEAVLIVCDVPLDTEEKLVFICPPPWLARLATRALAKALVAVWVAFRRRPDVVMGFHIFPTGVIALLAAAVGGSRAVFQATSGQVEFAGGGFASVNRVMGALRGPTPSVERAAIALANVFDRVIVRGSSARQFLEERNCSAQVEIMTGSVTPPAGVGDYETRKSELVIVGRLSDVKRLDRAVLVCRQLVSQRPELTLNLVGDGDQREALASLVHTHGLDENIHFVGQVDDAAPWYADALCFLLTSRSEGVSIAMLEAMTHGCVPVVADVGDLADFVTHGKNGFLVEADDIDGYAACILEALEPSTWRRLSTVAVETVTNRVTVPELARRWNQVLVF